MRKNIIYTLLAFAVLISTRCTKPASNLHIPPVLVHFIGEKAQNYPVEIDPAPVYKIRIGVTGATSEDRTATFKVVSPTGATAGTQYTLTGVTNNTVVIPAGEVTAEIGVQGVLSYYTSGRRDTLVFTLSEPSLTPASYSDTVKLILRGPCFDGTVGEAELNGLLGAYANTFDGGFGDYGPYNTSVVSVTPLTATTARAVINNVWDYGFGNINFILDWTDPANTTIKVEAPTVTPADAGALSAPYAGMNLVIRDHPNPGGASNKFSVCNGKLNLRYQFGVYNPSTGVILGYFGTVGTTTLSR